MKIKRNSCISFFFGFAQAFDFSGIIGGALLKSELNNTSERVYAFLNMLNKKDLPHDIDSLSGDWKNIGNDFRRALLRQE